MLNSNLHDWMLEGTCGKNALQDVADRENKQTAHALYARKPADSERRAMLLPADVVSALANT